MYLYMYWCLIEFIYQITKINWDVSEKSKKLNATNSVKTNNGIDYFTEKKAQWKSPKAYSALFIVAICKAFSHVLPVYCFRQSFESLFKYSQYFRHERSMGKISIIFFWTSLKVPLVTVMKVKSAVIWRKNINLFKAIMNLS